MYTGIVLEAYSPLGNPARPSHMKKDDEPSLFDDPVINEIAGKHKSTSAQVFSLMIMLLYLACMDTQNEINAWSWPLHNYTMICPGMHCPWSPSRYCGDPKDSDSIKNHRELQGNRGQVGC